jgi:transcriptional regulator with XRE-family HTH domain
MSTEHRSIVQAVIAEADRRAASAMDEKVNKGEALAQLLADREGLQYKPASVRAWMRGDAMPPADVLLAVARSVGISIDELAGRQPDSAEPTTERLDVLEGQVASLTEEVNRIREERRAQRLEWARRSQPAPPPTPQVPGGPSSGRPRGM